MMHHHPFRVKKATAVVSIRFIETVARIDVKLDWNKRKILSDFTVHRSTRRHGTMARLQGAPKCPPLRQRTMFDININHHVQAARNMNMNLVATKCRKREQLETLPFLPPESHAKLLLIRSIKGDLPPPP
jgi:hypothetical protein